LISEPGNDYELDKLEKATKKGHGLLNIDDDSKRFPKAQHVGVKSNGFFPRILKYLSDISDQDRKNIIINNRIDSYKKADSEQKDKLFSFHQLLSRVPEISLLFNEITGEPPHCFGITHSDKNLEEKEKQMRTAFAEGAEELEEKAESHYWLDIVSPQSIDANFLKKNGPPLTDWEENSDGDGIKWLGKLEVEEDQRWHEKLDTYRSAMCGTSWIQPIGNISDIMYIHFEILYLLSIIVRYRPKVWREISEGELDHYRPLIRYYIETFERTAPQVCLERITNRNIKATQPGSFLAPV
jgi:hypothetical protein